MLQWSALTKLKALIFNACGFNMYQTVIPSACQCSYALSVSSRYTVCVQTNEFLCAGKKACACMCECLCGRDGRHCACNCRCGLFRRVFISIALAKDNIFVPENRGLRTCTAPTTKKKRRLSHVPLHTQTSSDVVSFKYKRGHEATHEQTATIPVEIRKSYQSFLFAHMLKDPVGS